MFCDHSSNSALDRKSTQPPFLQGRNAQGLFLKVLQWVNVRLVVENMVFNTHPYTYWQFSLRIHSKISSYNFILFALSVWFPSCQGNHFRNFGEGFLGGKECLSLFILIGFRFVHLIKFRCAIRFIRGHATVSGLGLMLKGCFWRICPRLKLKISGSVIRTLSRCTGRFCGRSLCWRNHWICSPNDSLSWIRLSKHSLCFASLEVLSRITEILRRFELIVFLLNAKGLICSLFSIFGNLLNFAFMPFICFIYFELCLSYHEFYL